VAIKGEATVLRGLDALFNVGVIRDLTDGQLLERFSTGRGEAAEMAFAALVDRHGPMVLRVCRARLVDPHDALDAFQATFLVLVEKARGLWVRDSLGPWLHAVALRTASCARSAAEKRRRAERRAAEGRTEADEPAPTPDPGWERLLHEEIDRLPERYRVPIVLCDLEGNTCEEAARRMGRPVGTVKSWRSRGRDRLRVRLAKAGLVPSIALGAGLARASAPEAQDAIRALLERMTSGAFPASVGMLVKGVRKAMLLKRMGMTAALVWTATFVAIGVGAVVGAGGSASDPKGPDEEARKQATRQVDRRLDPPALAPAREPQGENWLLTLREAIRIGLENGKGVHFVAADAKEGSLTIARVDSALGPHRFKAEVMAMVRTIEQRYWQLSQQYVRLWTVEKALEMAQEILIREKEALKDGRGTQADVAEASQRLEQFNLDLVGRTSDVITSERQLRTILGVPLADNRQIIPTTAAVEAKLEPDWKVCLSSMLENQPDVALAREGSRANQVDLDAVARTLIPDLDDRGATGEATKRSVSIGSRALEQAIHQATRTMARFFLEVDANYKQYQTAKRLRSAAQQRLEAQRSYYDEGRITIDRLLDAVSQYSAAVSQEAEFKAAYNVSIVALEEAKGTLLAHDKIVVVGSPGGDESATVAAAESAKDEPSPKPTPARETSGRTMTFEATIRVGTIPIEIRGSVTVGPDAADDSEGR
jgi:RNA polymerase sigma factor (sigma-70 family)